MTSQLSDDTEDPFSGLTSQLSDDTDAIYLPFLDMMIQQLNRRFSSFTGRVVLSLVPSGIDSISTEMVEEILEYRKRIYPPLQLLHKNFKYGKFYGRVKLTNHETYRQL